MKCSVCNVELKPDHGSLVAGLAEVCETCAQPPRGNARQALIVARKPRFPLGAIVATPGALKALERAQQLPQEFLSRHVTGDWGEVDEQDWQENEFSVTHGFRLLSSYHTAAGEKLWVITEGDRSAMTLLRPDEY